ncbi:MAG: GIY-YIG nuclease family protein [Ignavibacteriales bacterium]|nr:GIY-YIG nuclease family protein [Ignavibacteriales bacterium]
MYYVYVLWSSKLQKRYVGYSNDINKRLEEHNKGKSRYTKSGIPWVLAYFEEFLNKHEAIIRELFLKTGQGRKFLDEKIGEAVRGFSARG